MAHFKNKNFKKRDYEATNVVACIADTAPDANYVPCEAEELSNLNFLWRENGVDFYGHL